MEIYGSISFQSSVSTYGSITFQFTMFKKKNFLSNIPQTGFEPMTCSRMKSANAYNLSATQLV